MKKPVFIFWMMAYALSIPAQNYFVTRSRDTTFCGSLEYATSGQGFIVHLSYVDKNGKTVDLKKRKNIPDITVIHYLGDDYVKMPLKTNKPNSYYRVGKVEVNGKLKVCKYDDRETKSVYRKADRYHPIAGMHDVTTGTYLFQLVMPDGKIVKINKHSNMKKIIRPYLQSCAAFVKAYKGNYSVEENAFIEMITLYNSVCNL